MGLNTHMGNQEGTKHFSVWNKNEWVLTEFDSPKFAKGKPCCIPIRRCQALCLAGRVHGVVSIASRRCGDERPEVRADLVILKRLNSSSKDGRFARAIMKLGVSSRTDTANEDVEQRWSEVGDVTGDWRAVKLFDAAVPRRVEGVVFVPIQIQTRIKKPTGQ
ncbi:hypothetical protein P171DRAFT_449883 [Karstenula rhodostoma CBS 690.94]|uniref:Uncharacterized protein n=1 Tax=Karstenula rhodostoma CBS 690.94 TaxID=1392251 RepID=A0A9P4P6Z0_9PLEO|nr:hypothetical protein P171DRAFT_449883 [Karstenula rhodostoma CBS 690.94]